MVGQVTTTASVIMTSDNDRQPLLMTASIAPGEFHCRLSAISRRSNRKVEPCHSPLSLSLLNVIKLEVYVGGPANFQKEP